MKVAVIGGIKSLSHSYRYEVEKYGFNPIVYNGYIQNMRRKLRFTDAIVLFTGTISHQASCTIRSLARDNDIPLVCCHSSGVSSLRRCLECLFNDTKQINSLETKSKSSAINEQ